MNRQQQLATELRELADQIEGGKLYFQVSRAYGKRNGNDTMTSAIAVVYSPLNRTLDGQVTASENQLFVRLSQ